MLRFECDYGEGAHPLILERLAATNLEQTPGYGTDQYCEQAKNLIRSACGNADTDIHFLMGGTQTNFTVITAALKPWQGVLAADTGHISAHETGAVEATGHKVLTLPHTNGKITAKQIMDYCTVHYDDGAREHTVQPGMVYISNPTEFGTLYSKDELTKISRVCLKFNLTLFVDGARMGYGLMSKANDLSLPDYAELCDAFTIGGTKNGALFGEAVVLKSPALRHDFRYSIKQHGGMLAKGRLLGIQFCVLFEDGLYFRMADHAVKQAMRLRRAFEERGWPLLVDSSTNQQFPIIPNDEIARLSQQFTFCFWQKTDNTHSAVRFCTSWASSEEAVNKLIKAIKKE